jgi:hypothetical protein
MDIRHLFATAASYARRGASGAGSAMDGFSDRAEAAVSMHVPHSVFAMTYLRCAYVIETTRLGIRCAVLLGREPRRAMGTQCCVGAGKNQSEGNA